MLEWITVHCPYCGEPFDASVDCSAGDQIYTEDCQICCNPILFKISVGPAGSLFNVEFERENE